MHAFVLTLLTFLSAGAAPELPAEQSAAAVKAYHALSNTDYQEHKLSPMALPKARYAEVDVSAHIRSASFGHKTALLVAADQKDFPVTYYVRYGRSTNTKEQLFGPFKAAALPAAPQASPDAGQ